MLTEIAQGVWRLALPSQTLPPFDHTNSYLLCDADRAVLVDCGGADDKAWQLLLASFERLGLTTLSALWLTHSHPDHCEGIARLQQHWPELVVWGHSFELQRRPEIIHPRPWQEGVSWQCGQLTIQPLFTPGHSPGHLSFYIVERKLILVGDMLANKGSVWVGVPEGNVTAYLGSLKRLEDLDAELLAPGHGEMVQNPQKRIQEVREHRLTREKEVLSALKWAKDVASLRGYIYPDLQGRLSEMAESTIAAHLERLVEQGRVIQKEKTFIPGNEGSWDDS